MWGQEQNVWFRYMVSGIIPTRVGTSTLNNPRTYTTRDHPHACGDKKRTPASSICTKGSSPRVWGQEAYFDKAFNAARIIPTRVGTSCRHSVRVYAHRDHPHACGDKLTLTLQSICPIGSSPRVWGQVEHTTHEDGEKGIIPTRVGTR